jgi:hypothetical protein
MVFALCIKHNRDVAHSEGSHTTQSHRFRLGMLTGNGKCDCIFRAHLSFCAVRKWKGENIQWIY